MVTSKEPPIKGRRPKYPSIGYQMVLTKLESGTFHNAGNPSRSKKSKMRVTNKILE